jgi:hypothetical protein
MDLFSCDECRAIYRELRDALARRAGQNSTPQKIAAWVQRLDEDECARLRGSSDLWKAWRRLQEHRVLTGHWQPVLTLPPDALSNPN